ncbi:unnamed protein product [Cyprideis torosa]|uniref:Uncharacterized protein n=1 Tax=Cyprideis torosa TaxID=163714 RepID=A0A7R8WMB1_9CRUS|nr:unnamed protein product [Cyprideis torosa]CAG0905089.1 unnamed protein product [Cyprideis torosa]
MLYYFFTYIESNYNLPGAGLFAYNSFRAGMAAIMALFIALIFGKRIINYLRRKQLGETVRDLGLEGQIEKTGTPTMGGFIIILGALVPVLLFAKLHNPYIILLLISTLWMGGIGFLDDYIKVFRKNKDGLSGKFKVMGQVGLGLIVGLTLFFHPDVVVKENLPQDQKKISIDESGRLHREYFGEAKKMTTTNVPFVKSNQLNYSSLTIGGLIAVIAVMLRKELLIPVLCGIFLVENLSVMLQVSWFKYTKKRYGEGRRIFLMSPLHHHFQMKNYHESKIVNRFLIIGVLLALISVLTLKLR